MMLTVPLNSRNCEEDVNFVGLLCVRAFFFLLFYNMSST